MIEYLSAKQAAEKWGISPRRVGFLCAEGRISGTYKIGKTWLIPAGEDKPVDARIKSGIYIKHKMG